MTRFSIKIENILGLSYYRYELTSSTYNATINTAFTITCKCTDVFGNNVSGKQLTLYGNGTSIGTANTDSNGIATWNISPSTLGKINYNVSNAYCQVDINDTGWKNATMKSGWTAYDSNSTLQYRRIRNIVEVSGIVKPTSNKTGTAHEVATISDSNCRPLKPVRFYSSGFGNYHFITYVNTEGTIGFDRHYNGTTSQSSATTDNAFIMNGRYIVK